MYTQTRGGTRGGAAEFKWSDVGADKDRENYLGHSINAPTGRWQKNKDVHWYAREAQDTEAERREEIRKIKEAEEDALATALGFAPANRTTITAAPSSSSGPPKTESELEEEKKAQEAEKEEKRRRKEEKRQQKEEKRSRKEHRALARDRDDRSRGMRDNRHRSLSRTRSPSRERHRRTISPPAKRRSRSPHRLPHNGDRNAIYSRNHREARDRSRSRSPPYRSRHESDRGDRRGEDSMEERYRRHSLKPEDRDSRGRR